MQNYTVEKFLGEGSWGKTFKAVNKEDGKTYAIKEIKQRSGNYLEKSQAQHFIANEYEVLQMVLTICQTSVPCLKEAFYESSKFYIVMDFIQGFDVWTAMCDDIKLGSTRLPRQKRRDEYLSIIAHDLAVGIRRLHDLGVIHQDIKGENIMYDQNSATFKLIDFGLSCITSKGIEAEGGKMYSPLFVNAPCGVPGTVYTLPPEMIDPKTTMPITNSVFPENWLKAHDIWSIGCVIFTWFTFPDEIHIVDDNVVESIYYGMRFDDDVEMYDGFFEELRDYNSDIYDLLMVCFQRDPFVRVFTFEEMANNMITGVNAKPAYRVNWDNQQITLAAKQNLAKWQRANSTASYISESIYMSSLRTGEPPQLLSTLKSRAASTQASQATSTTQTASTTRKVPKRAKLTSNPPPKKVSIPTGDDIFADLEKAEFNIEDLDV
jgi:serine/threonine protein kinase